jgi:hypothetical protein
VPWHAYSRLVRGLLVRGRARPQRELSHAYNSFSLHAYIHTYIHTYIRIISLIRLSDKSVILSSISFIRLSDKSLILLKLLDISALFCDISVLCSSVVCKYVVFKVVTVYFKSLTSWNKSEFTIVAEPYRPVELILIIIL